MFYLIDSDTHAQFYGGNQNWFSSNTRAYAGCGAVAAANTWTALLEKYPVLSKSITPNSTLAHHNTVSSPASAFCSREGFTELMNDMYKAIGTFEVPILNRIYDRCQREHKFFKVIPPTVGRSIYGFVKGFLRYAQKNGVYLHAHILPTAFCPYDSGLHFIEDGLKESGTVVLLTSFNRHPLTLYHDTCGKTEHPYELKGGMRCHFASITDILAESQDSKQDSPLLLLSTWGRVASVDLKALTASWQSRKALDSALFYFTPATSPEISKADIKNARRMLFQAIRQTLFKKYYN